MKDSDKQKPMSWIAFQFMRLIMNMRKRFRNIEQEIRLAGIEKGFYILDFGCGLGFNTIAAAKAIGKEGRVFALDLSKHAIKVMKRKIRKNKLHNVEVIRSDCNTGLADKSIDLVFLHNTLPIVREKQKVLDEISRVIKTGGKLSYMSRIGARIYGKDTISKAKLKEILSSDFRLKKEINGQLIFERIS
ncbi:MAG: hypothetical protein CSA05_01035 [Bacteroidia bacterium]|nr:MAG: hypothetical protein CSA05_01035 [Bacteroidia bacterium]